MDSNFILWVSTGIISLRQYQWVPTRFGLVQKRQKLSWIQTISCEYRHGKAIQLIWFGAKSNRKYCGLKLYLVGTQWDLLMEAIPMSTNKICFGAKISYLERSAITQVFSSDIVWIQDNFCHFLHQNIPCEYSLVPTRYGSVQKQS